MVILNSVLFFIVMLICFIIGRVVTNLSVLLITVISLKLEFLSLTQDDFVSLKEAGSPSDNFVYLMMMLFGSVVMAIKSYTLYHVIFAALYTGFAIALYDNLFAVAY